jgi:cytochrome c-type biogenesis protein CcmE
MKTRIRLLAIFGVLGLGLLILISQGFKGAMVYSITVTEMVERGETGRLDGLRVVGKVVEGSIEHKPADNYLRFTMSDGTTDIPVVYRGIVPDTFAEMGEVTVEGSYRPGDAFEATFLMAKCPSKYEVDHEEFEAAGYERPGAHPE